MYARHNVRRHWASVASFFFLFGSLTFSFAAATAWAASQTAYAASLPPALRAVLYQTLAKDEGPSYQIKPNGCATPPGQALKACFDTRGAHFSAANMPEFALHLAAYGRGKRLTAANPVAPTIAANRVRYAHGNVTEWWRVLPIGFEQGFTVNKRSGGHGEFTLALATNGEASQHKGTLGWGKLRYGRLLVSDATGKVIPATLAKKGDRILIAVNDSGAHYPLTVDPLVWIEQKVTASDGVHQDWFGNSVAISGRTALVGAPNATVNSHGYQGAAYVFAESGGTWAQTAKLTASDGATGDEFGYSVALDGGTAVIGAIGATVNGNGGAGAAYVFRNSGGSWSQTDKLRAIHPIPFARLGRSVAVSGTTALIGAPSTNIGIHEGQGAAYVYSESGGSWTQVQELAPSGSEGFGSSVALDGTTALVGTSVVASGGAAAYLFTQSGGSWTQTDEFTPSGGLLGVSVALDGPIALLGAPLANVGSNSGQGAVYVFEKSGNTWAQTSELTASDGAAGDQFGFSVALDGATAIVGAKFATINSNSEQGAAYMFSESGGAWSQSQKLMASDGATGDQFGTSVALDGSSALVGASLADEGGNFDQGAAYFYGASDLGLAVSAPDTVSPGQTYTSQIIATNNASAASPAVTATVSVPAAASFVSASATQGSCSEASSVVTCDFGQIDGNAGTATANVTLKATGNNGDTIENTASVFKATPPLTASATTSIATNHPPVASNGSLMANENTAASGTLKATDADDDPLTFSIVTNPGHGSVTINDTSTSAYIYTPNQGYSGSDSFTFKANDGHADSNTATVNVTVKASGGGGSGGGGGGSFGWLGLAALFGLVLSGLRPTRRPG